MIIMNESARGEGEYLDKGALVFEITRYKG